MESMPGTVDPADGADDADGAPGTDGAADAAGAVAAGPASPAVPASPDRDGFSLGLPSSAPPRGLSPSPGLQPSPGLPKPADLGFPAGGFGREAGAAPKPPAAPALPEMPALPETPALPEALPLPETPAPAAAGSPSGAVSAAPTAAPTPARVRRAGVGAGVGRAAGEAGRRSLIRGLAVAGGFVVLGILALSGAVGSLFGGGGGGAAGPEETVEAYLTALSEGDAGAALAGIEAEARGPLLTDEALAESARLAPLESVEVREGADGDGPTRTVSASFALGDRRVFRDFTVREHEEGWRVVDGLVEVPLDALAPYAPSLNGIPVGGDTALLFPGGYELALGVEEFAVPEGEGLIVAGDILEVPDAQWISPVLTPEGEERFREMVRESLESCLAETSITTECGMNVDETVDDGYRVIDGAVQRSLTETGEAALDALAPVADSGEPGSVTAYDYLDIEIRLEVERDGERRTGTLMAPEGVLTPVVDFTASDPRVTWE
ncbi:hypothetical protein JD276_09060 [Leucobacter sp. CSA1]|uniref:DUF4878 domain-containing protein n=1 Tax=Leucobacter chromiisoli TaxID=2796471 RepID=A0A934UV83_9MICO|nr:hypothetical protein [Leucobacter chromiisoli]MBK0419181.1 hypothetical protein [Leucobacter chromiisoli]